MDRSKWIRTLRSTPCISPRVNYRERSCTFELNSDPYDVNVKQLSVAIERIYEIIPRIWYAPVVASSAMI